MKGFAVPAVLCGLLGSAGCGPLPEGPGAGGVTEVTVERVEGPVETGTLYWDGLGPDGQMIGGSVEQAITPVTLRVRAVGGGPLNEANRAEAAAGLPSCADGAAVEGVEARPEDDVLVLSFRCVRSLG